MKIVFFLLSFLALVCVVFSRSFNNKDKPKAVGSKKKGNLGKKAKKKPKKVGKNIFDTVGDSKGKQKKKKKNF